MKEVHYKQCYTIHTNPVKWRDPMYRPTCTCTCRAGHPGVLVIVCFVFVVYKHTYKMYPLYCI